MKQIKKGTPSYDVVGKPQEDVLNDIDCILQSKYTPKKHQSEKLSVLYRDLGMPTRAQRVFDCGTFLEFASPVLADGSLGSASLFKANFCKDRFCPLCSWRKSLKLFGQVSAVMDYIQKDYKFLFLTLTVINCEGPELKDLISRMLEALHLMFRRREVKRIVKGYFRTLEITRNRENGTFHPHIHLILAVDPSYAQHGADYIDQKDWLRYWRESMRDPNITQVYVQLVKADKKLDPKEEISFKKAIAEISKYSVKGHDVIVNKEVLKYLGQALYHRRLFHFAGCFKQAFKDLLLVDVESSEIDLTDTPVINPTVAYLLVRYEWSCGVYKAIDPKIVKPDYFEVRKKALNNHSM